MGGGGGMKSDIIRTKEQEQMYGYGTSILDQMQNAMLTGQGLWNVPQMPQMYNPVQPTAGWYSGIAPEVQQGLWEPVKEAGRQMQETFGSRGQLGSPRAGQSGAWGAAVGELYGRAAPQIGMQAWNMMAPYQQQYNQDLLNMGIMQQQQQLQSQMAPWQMFPQMMGAQQAFMPQVISYQQAPSLGQQLLGQAVGGLAGSFSSSLGGGLGLGAANSALGGGLGKLLGGGT